tara:strand:+ start:157 stop:303 length:147 start_codon:yes stop_codon:yes gene_type:complete
MASLKLKSNEVGWIKYSLIRTVSTLEGKEEKILRDLLNKIEKQEKEQI